MTDAFALLQHISAVPPLFAVFKPTILEEWMRAAGYRLAISLLLHQSHSSSKAGVWLRGCPVL